VSVCAATTQTPAPIAPTRWPMAMPTRRPRLFIQAPSRYDATPAPSVSVAWVRPAAPVEPDISTARIPLTAKVMVTAMLPRT
jgi:hypothetical protein